MANIVVKLAPGVKAPAKGDCLAGGVVISSFPDEPWVVVQRDDYAYGVFEDDPNVTEHRPEEDVHPLLVPVTPRLMAAPSVGDTFPMIGITDDVLRRGNWGADVVLATVDTGCYTAHKAFEGKNMIGDTEDSHGHGTHVASTAASAWGIASDATIYIKRALSNKNGSGSESAVANGLQEVADWAVLNKALVVINLSLGGNPSGPIDAGVRYCQQRGLWVCAAAGNDGADATIGSPARQADFVVGAVDRDSQIADFSSGNGTWQQITCYMPGVGIAAAQANTDDGVLVISGTSMASPHLAGLLTFLRRAGMSLVDARNYIYAHLTAMQTANHKGLFVIQPDFGTESATPVPVAPVDWRTEIKEIADEVIELMDKEPLDPTPVKDYMDKIKDLIPTTDPKPTEEVVTVPPDNIWDGGTQVFNYGASRDNSISVSGKEGLTQSPVIVLFAGGGWIAKPQVPDRIANWFVSQGVLLVIPSYRVGDVLNSLQDVGNAMKYVFQHATEWGGDPNRISYVGHSAGGHLAWMAALDSRWGAPVPKNVISLAGAGLAIDASTKNSSFARYLQAWGDPNTWQANSPWSHVSDGRRVQGIVVHGMDDNQVPPAQAEAFVRAAQSAGLRVTLMELPGANHLTVGDPTSNEIIAQTLKKLWS